MSLPIQLLDEELLKAANAVRRGVTRLARRLRTERSADAISLSKLSVLGRLSRGGPLTASDIAGQERIQPQSLTRLLTDLEEQALITRAEDEQDRRQLLIEITPGGTELLIRDARQQAVWLGRAMSSLLSPVEQEVLRLAAQLMQQLADADAPAAASRSESEKGSRTGDDRGTPSQ
jgi:DNA-binding MarR family transcriptional regulator